jgi:hypothetical protein
VIPLLVYLTIAGAHAPIIGDQAPQAAFVGLDGEPVSLPANEITVVAFFGFDLDLVAHSSDAT